LLCANAVNQERVNAVIATYFERIETNMHNHVKYIRLCFCNHSLVTVQKSRVSFIFYPEV